MSEAAFPDQRLSIITLGAHDRAALTGFYEEVLGFTDFGPPAMTMFDMGGFVLGIWEVDKLAADAGQAPRGEVPGFKGLALAYNTRTKAEVDEIFERLRACGANITVAPHDSFWGGYSGYFADPEGNAWEVAYNPFWPLDENGRVVIPPGKDS